jgi:hypothetical protein
MEVLLIRNGKVGFVVMSALELALVERDPVGAACVADHNWPATTAVPTLATTLARCPFVYVDLVCTMTLFDTAVLVVVFDGAITKTGVVGMPPFIKTAADATRHGNDLLTREPVLIEAIMNTRTVGPNAHHHGGGAVAAGVSVGRLLGLVLTTKA